VFPVFKSLDSYQTRWMMATSPTREGSKPQRTSASLTVVVANYGNGTSFSEPPKVPIAVRTAATIKISGVDMGGFRYG
jgi:hypothetical protein